MICRFTQKWRADINQIYSRYRVNISRYIIALSLIILFQLMHYSSVSLGRDDNKNNIMEDSLSKMPTDSKENIQTSSNKGATGPWEWEDPYPIKMIASETAIMQERKTVGFVFNSGALVYGFPFFSLLETSIGISRNFSLRIDFMPPLYPSPLQLLLGLGVYPKIGFHPTKYLKIAFMLDLGIFQPVPLPGFGCHIEGAHLCQPQLFYGGTPILFVVGDNNYFLNISLTVLGYRGFPDFCWTASEVGDCGIKQHHQVITIPSIGLSVRLSRRLKISFEILFIIKHDLVEPESVYLIRYVLVPMTGLKIIGKTVHGSINIGLLFLKYYGESEKMELHVPFAFPLLSFGFNYPLSRLGDKKASASYNPQKE